jgi:AcrR family transcriptional regulator
MDRDAWVEAALAALSEGGVDAVRVEAIARQLGVSKGSFYWHFRDRADLLDALLARWRQEGTEAIIALVDASEGDAQQRLRTLWATTQAGPHSYAAELAIRDWSRRDENVAAIVTQVDERRMQYVRDLLAELGLPRLEIEARALALYSLLIGNYFIHTGHGRYGRARVLEAAVERLVGR